MDAPGAGPPKFFGLEPPLHIITLKRVLSFFYAVLLLYLVHLMPKNASNMKLLMSR
jgi:hypothetical protein